MIKFNRLFILFFILVSCVFFSCTSIEKDVIEQIEVPSEPIPAPVVPSVIEPVIVPEPIIKNEEIVPTKKDVSKTAEYQRSVSALAGDDIVSEDEFTEDKKNVLDTIEKLAVIMSEMNYKEWLKYVTPKSKQYWANPKNLLAVSNRLPVKGLKIRSLEDYFKYVFVPSRLDRVVDEIRYVSATIVKAVQVNDEQDIIFYYFEKIDGKWLLKLDQLES